MITVNREKVVHLIDKQTDGNEPLNDAALQQLRKHKEYGIPSNIASACIQDALKQLSKAATAS